MGSTKSRLSDPARGNRRAGRPIQVLQAANQALQHKNKQYTAVFQLPGCPRTDQRTENQAEVECADVNQLPLEYILVASQMSPPHCSGIVTMREAPFNQFASLAKQTLAIVSRYPLPVAVDGLLLILLSNPVPFAGLLLFRNVGSHRSYF